MGIDKETKDFFVAQMQQLNTRFDIVDKKFDAIDARFDAQDKKFDARFDAQDKKFDARFDAQDKKFDARFDAQDKKFDAKLDGMEKKFDAKLDAQLIDITNVIYELGSMINKRLDILEDDMAANRKILLEREDTTKEKVDAHDDQIVVAFQHIDRIEEHLHIPHTLAV